MTVATTDDHTRAEWRELGFHYDRNDDACAWLIEGTQAGLLRFASCLREFAEDPANEAVSEHEHYGPYMYLEFMSALTPEINGHCIQGTPADLLRLAELAEARSRQLGVGETVELSAEYAPKSPYQLRLRAHAEGTDPASLDSQLEGHI